MLLSAARAVANTVSQSDLKSGCVYPEMGGLRVISRAVAQAVAESAVNDGVTGSEASSEDAEAIARQIDDQIWSPHYIPYRYEPDIA
jgi:malic enzyme